jgi:predicted ATPase with chaperone activity
MLAKRMATILPSLNLRGCPRDDEDPSVAGVLDASGVVGPLPFRSPHHITSMRDLSALA